jgi:beta-lactamase class D
MYRAGVNLSTRLLGALAALVCTPGCISPPTAPRSSAVLGPASGCAELLDRERSTFVLHEVRSGRTLVCNAERAARRFIPASTYKVPHALIALETGVVRDEHAPFKWDGQKRGVAAWDKDTSLAQGIEASTVWVFQQVAAQVGHRRESVAVRRLGYGNMEVGTPADLRHFWLVGPLEISAIEQVRFLTNLRAGRLRADRRNQARTAAMLRLRDCESGCTIFGKTGAVLPIDDQGFLKKPGTSFLPQGRERTGWFVGWIERSEAAGGPVVFAHNLDLASSGAMSARTAVAYKILNANGVRISNPD